jgi:hypothetical protein
MRVSARFSNSSLRGVFVQCRELRREKPINARTDGSNARRGPDQEATMKKIASLHSAPRQHWVAMARFGRIAA